MMSVHTDYIVSMQILSTLMEITIRNGEYISLLWLTVWNIGCYEHDLFHIAKH